MRMKKINPDSDWGRAPRWKRRLHGFACYMVCAVMALWHPEAVDMALLDTLRKQFVEE
jgi:hypothetical protein